MILAKTLNVLVSFASSFFVIIFLYFLTKTNAILTVYSNIIVKSFGMSFQSTGVVVVDQNRKEDTQ